MNAKELKGYELNWVARAWIQRSASALVRGVRLDFNDFLVENNLVISKNFAGKIILEVDDTTKGFVKPREE